MTHTDTKGWPRKWGPVADLTQANRVKRGWLPAWTSHSVTRLYSDGADSYLSQPRYLNPESITDLHALAEQGWKFRIMPSPTSPNRLLIEIAEEHVFDRDTTPTSERGTLV